MVLNLDEFDPSGFDPTDGQAFIESQKDFLCKTMYHIMDAALSDALRYFRDEDIPYEPFLCSGILRNKANFYLKEMRLKRCTVVHLLNNGIHIKFPRVEYKVWKSLSNPGASSTKGSYLTQPNIIQPNVKQELLPLEGMVNVYRLPLRLGLPLRLVMLWNINEGGKIELFLACPKDLTPDASGVTFHWKLPILRLEELKIRQEDEGTTAESNDLDLIENEETLSDSNDLDLDEDTGTDSE